MHTVAWNMLTTTEHIFSTAFGASSAFIRPVLSLVNYPLLLFVVLYILHEKWSDREHLFSGVIIKAN